MAMIKCQNCGKSVSDSEKMCPYCDEQIKRDFFCPKCGSKNIGLSDVGIDPKTANAHRTVGVATRHSGLIGGLITMLFVKAKNPDLKSSEVEYLCKDCEHKFRRY